MFFNSSKQFCSADRKSVEMMSCNISKQCCSDDISISVQTIVRGRKLALPLGEKEYLVWNRHEIHTRCEAYTDIHEKYTKYIGSARENSNTIKKIHRFVHMKENRPKINLSYVCCCWWWWWWWWWHPHQGGATPSVSCFIKCYKQKQTLTGS